MAGKTRTYSADEIAARLEGDLPHWSFKDGHICRTYRTYGWKGALMVVGVVGHLAEAAWHHPDLAVSYNSVEVKLMTRDANGITDKDFELARKIDDVVAWQPGKVGGVLDGTPESKQYAYIKYD